MKETPFQIGLRVHAALPDLSDQLQDAVNRMTEYHAILMDGLTERQVAEAFRQAVILATRSKIAIDGLTEIGSPPPFVGGEYCERIAWNTLLSMSQVKKEQTP